LIASPTTPDPSSAARSSAKRSATKHSRSLGSPRHARHPPKRRRLLLLVVALVSLSVPRSPGRPRHPVVVDFPRLPRHPRYPGSIVVISVRHARTQSERGKSLARQRSWRWPRSSSDSSPSSCKPRCKLLFLCNTDSASPPTDSDASPGPRLIHDLTPEICARGGYSRLCRGLRRPRLSPPSDGGTDSLGSAAGPALVVRRPPPRPAWKGTRPRYRSRTSSDAATSGNAKPTGAAGSPHSRQQEREKSFVSAGNADASCNRSAGNGGGDIRSDVSGIGTSHDYLRSGAGRGC
jgi:hypothetical protein